MNGKRQKKSKFLVPLILNFDAGNRQHRCPQACGREESQELARSDPAARSWRRDACGYWPLLQSEPAGRFLTAWAYQSGASSPPPPPKESNDHFGCDIDSGVRGCVTTTTSIDPRHPAPQGAGVQDDQTIVQEHDIIQNQFVSGLNPGM
jgi:hypothetical protein